MTATAPSTTTPAHAPLSVTAFVALMAAVMALNALATDIMLPGLPEIAEATGAADTTEVQAVITLYLIGFGLGQLVAGLLADRFGRRLVLLPGLVVYAVAGLVTALAPDLTVLLVARFVQGVGASATRVIATAMIRDCYEGRTMARIMSLTMMVFMAAPVFAPALGQVILLTTSWRWVFGVLTIYGVVLTILAARHLPETLPKAERRPIRLALIRAGLGSIFGSRQTVGYTLAAGIFFGALFSLINSAQQVMVDVYDTGLWFPAIFAGVSVCIALASFVNARIVERFGMRVLSQGAVCAFCVLSGVMVLLGRAEMLTLLPFLVLLSATLTLVGLVFSNFNALALAPQGHVAGLASSVIGGTTALMGSSIGYLVGQSFDDTAVPMVTGFLLCGVAALAIVAVTERGMLFRSGPEQPESA
ncbi:MAG: multidrug effflux MFS transporter [Pseudomonadota bacterium]